MLWSQVWWLLPSTPAFMGIQDYNSINNNNEKYLKEMCRLHVEKTHNSAEGAGAITQLSEKQRKENCAF